MDSDLDLLGWDDAAVADVARLRGWTEAAIARLSLTWRARDSRVGIPVCDETGTELGELHYDPTGTRHPKMVADAGTPRALFPPPELIADRDLVDRTIWLLEGEPDTVRAWSLGLAAVGVPGAQNWRDEWAARFAGRGWRVVVLFDADQAGRAGALRAANAIAAAGVDVRLVDLGSTLDDGHDLTDWAAAAVDAPTRGEARDALQAIADRTDSYRPPKSDGVGVFALDVDEFRMLDETQPPPLLGSDGDTILPAGGLIVIAGQPGVGKTTLVVDLVYHLASGRDWLGLACSRPLNVLLIENEGPEHMFRQKINIKTNAWTHDRLGRIWVQTWRWGYFSFSEVSAAAALEEFAREHAIDVIVGDPLGTLGPAGVGSPEDTRRFIAQIRELELPAAYVFVHHFRKEPLPNEVDQLSGSWAGHLDTLLLVKPTRRRNEVRLSFPKTRWAEQASHKPLILGYVRATQGFEVLGEEGDAKLLEQALVDALEQAGAARTPTELAKDVGSRRAKVEACLKGNTHLFGEVAGADVGRPRAKLLYQLVPQQPDNLGQAGQADGVESDSNDLGTHSLSLLVPASIEAGQGQVDTGREADSLS